MRMINVDDETIALLEGAALTLEAALAARAERVDPEGIISRSFEMSRIKTTEAVRQLRRPKPKDLSEYTIAEKAVLMNLLQMVLNEKDPHTQAIAFRKLRGACFCYHGEPQPQSLGEAPENGSLRDITMAADATLASLGETPVRSKMRKNSKSATPHRKPR